MGATFMFSMKMKLPPVEDEEEEIKQYNIVEEKEVTS